MTSGECLKGKNGRTESRENGVTCINPVPTYWRVRSRSRYYPSTNTRISGRFLYRTPWKTMTVTSERTTGVGGVGGSGESRNVNSRVRDPFPVTKPIIRIPLLHPKSTGINDGRQHLNNELLD